jgi:hypothetical protein
MGIAAVTAGFGVHMHVWCGLSHPWGAALPQLFASPVSAAWCTQQIVFCVGSGRLSGESPSTAGVCALQGMCRQRPDVMRPLSARAHIHTLAFHIQTVNTGNTD